MQALFCGRLSRHCSSPALQRLPHHAKALSQGKSRIVVAPAIEVPPLTHTLLQHTGELCLQVVLWLSPPISCTMIHGSSQSQMHLTLCVTVQ